MLLFILHFHYLSDIFIYFKTSYVIVYLLTFACNLCSFIFQNILCYCLSITALIDEPIGLIFQNILCYCLSSAVSVLVFSYTAFQNILCYCLSFSTVGQGLLDLAFQNILCYCLSPYGIRFRNR